MDLSTGDWIKFATMLVMGANMALNLYLWLRTASANELKAMRRAQIEGDQHLGSRVSAVEALCRQDASILRGLHGDVDKRLSVLETRVQALPTHADIGDIRDALSQMGAELAANTERTTALLDTMRSVQRYLLENRS
jgi:hypothetical protein